MTVACSTVLAAGAATGTMFWTDRSATAGLDDNLQPSTARQAGAAGSQYRLGQSLADYASQRARSQASAAVQAARRAAAARAARAKAARERAARQAALRAAASASPTPTPAPAPSSPAPVSTTPTPTAPSGSPRQIAESLLSSYGWSSSQFSCLDPLWNAESGWNPTAQNTASGAYGIPQALPGSKMASAGPDWQTDATTQIKWGLGYIKGTYGSPCSAWAHEQSTGWY
jgi:hypothetical protein